MDFGSLAAFIGVGGAALVGLFGFLFWVLNTYFVDKKELAEFEKEKIKPLIESASKSVSFRHLEAYKNDVAKLHGDMQAMTAQITGVGDRLKPIERHLEMLVQHHINMPKQ